MQRIIYLEFTWKQHSGYNSLIQYPPEGYVFATDKSLESSTIKLASRFRFAYSVLNSLDPIMPVHLFKSRMGKYKHPPQGSVLTYSINHLVFRDEPWILDLTGEHLTDTLGGFRHFKRFKPLVERLLSSDRCRCIIMDKVAISKVLEKCLDIDLRQKIHIVNWAVPARKFTKCYDTSKVKLLFLGSSNIPGQFHDKGGKEVLEAFLLLRQRYRNIEMVMRSDIPEELKERCEGIEGLTVIDKVIAWDQLELLCMTADILVVPTHVPLLWVFLDAMSFELPVVTTDAWGNSEIVKDGINGMIVHDSGVAANYDWLLSHSFIPPKGSREYEAVVGKTNQQMVQDLVSKLGYLIENHELRRTMGKAGRDEVELGKFSIASRNTTLTKIFDTALDK